MIACLFGNVLFFNCLSLLYEEILGQRGHGSVLRADEGRNLDGQRVGLVDGLALQDGCAERTVKESPAPTVSATSTFGVG